MGDAGFPFLFYGPSPDDWFDEPVHAWQLRFAQAPSPAQRASLAAAWERAARDEARNLGANFNQPWWWSGPWALAPCRVGDRSRDAMRALFEAVQRMLRAAHAVAPLAEVVYAQASDVSSHSAWEAWTVAQAPLPAEAPAWPAEAVTHAKRSRKRSKAAVDVAFEAARAQARKGGAAPVPSATPDDDVEPAASARDAAPSSDDASDDASQDEASGSVALPEPRGVPLHLEAVYPKPVEAQRKAEHAPALKEFSALPLRDGTWTVGVRTSKKDKAPRLGVILDGEVKTTPHPGVWNYAVRSWSPERRELLIENPDGDGVVTATLDDAAVRVVWDDPLRDGTSAAFWLAGGTMFLGNRRGACAWRPSGAGFVAGSYHAWSIDQDQCVTTADRRGLVTLENDDDKALLQVVVPVDGALRIAGEAAVATDDYPSLLILSDGLYLYSPAGAWRLDGIDAAIDALLANAGDTTRFPLLPAASSPEERVDPARNTDADECMQRGERATTARDDDAAERWFRRVVALDPARLDGWHALGRLLLRTGREPEARDCLGRALAGYDAQIADDEDARFRKAAVLSVLRRRADTIALLRGAIAPGHDGNWSREEVLGDEDHAWLRADPDFVALTTKVARPKRASKKKAAREADGEADDA